MPDRQVLLALLIGLVAAPAGAQDIATDSGTAHFDWFEYTGHDAVYEGLDAGPDQYRNPILAGFYPDPSIVRVDDAYYLVNSSFAYYPGIPIFRSRDLVHWTQLGHVLTRPTQLPLDSLRISRGVFAPTIRHHDGTFYVICTLVDAGGNFLVTADDPAGPWSDPVWLPFDGIDPSMFFDDDGRVYITNNGAPDYEPLYEGHRALWIQEYDPESREMVGPRRVIVDAGVDIEQEPIWIEAPHIFKVDGTYYLIAAEGGTGYDHSQVVFRSDDVFGPYEPFEHNPILTQRHLDPDRPHPVTSAGHADFVQLPNGDWWAVFLATRPYAGGHYNTGRETFLLPVTWTETGWPVILEGDATVPYVQERPDLPAQRPPDVPKNGNFTYIDDFDGDALLPYWTFIRTPARRWHRVQGGWLSVQGRDAPLTSLQQPSFVGRRQQHVHATVSTAMRYYPQQEGDHAGIAAFQNRQHFFLLAVAQVDGAPVVQLQRAAGGETEIIASAGIDLPADGPVYLRIEARGEAYDFSYGLAPGEWIPLLEGADGTLLSTETAGGFVGAMFGLYAFAAEP